MAKRKLKAAAYIRVSTAGQVEEGGSLPEQRETLTKRIEAEGWELAGVYADEGISGRREDRPELQRLLADLPQLDRVVVTELSRLGRRAKGMLELFERFEAEDVALVATRQSIDTSSAAGRLLRNVLISVAEFESENMGERVAAVARSKVATKGEHHGRPPFGYQSKAGQLVPDPATAPAVKSMFKDAAAGKSQRSIARRLNSEGVAPMGGGKWGVSQIGRILRNPTFKGTVEINGEQHAGAHKALVSVKLWDKVEAMRQERTRSTKGGPGRRPAGRQLFTRGLLRCGLCGGAMSPRTHPNGREEYRCVTRVEQGQGENSCTMLAVEREPIDSAALAYFERVALDADALREEIASEVTKQRDRVKRQLREAVADERKAADRLDRVRRDYQDEKIDADDWHEQRGQLSGELAAARAQLKQAEAREAALVAAEEDAGNPESRAQARLQAIREAVAGKIADSDGDVEALRHALTNMFEAFIIVPADPEKRGGPDWLPGEAEAVAAVRRQIAAQKRDEFDFEVGGYKVFPMPRPETVEGLGAVFSPMLKRRGLKREQSDSEGLTR